MPPSERPVKYVRERSIAYASLTSSSIRITERVSGLFMVIDQVSPNDFGESRK